MVQIDFSFEQASGLKRVAESLVLLFERNAIAAKAGVVQPPEACPFLVVIPDQDSTIEDMNSVIRTLKAEYGSKALAGDQMAGQIDILLDTIRIHPDTDTLPPSIIVQAGQMIMDDLADRLHGFTTFEAA